MIPHTGTETRTRLLREAAVEEYWAMDASLTQPCRVQDEGPLGCKLLLSGKKTPMRGELTVPEE